MDSKQLSLFSLTEKGGRPPGSHDLKARVLRRISEGVGVTFAELCRDVPGFEGDHLCGLRAYNLVRWPAVSQDGARALGELVEDGMIKETIVPDLVYYDEGAVPNLPVAKQLGRAYKEPHWVPVVFNATVGGVS